MVSISFGGSSPLPRPGANGYDLWRISFAVSGTSWTGGLSASFGLKRVRLVSYSGTPSSSSFSFCFRIISRGREHLNLTSAGRVWQVRVWVVVGTVVLTASQRGYELTHWTRFLRPGRLHHCVRTPGSSTHTQSHSGRFIAVSSDLLSIVHNTIRKQWVQTVCHTGALLSADCEIHTAYLVG